MTEIVVKNMTAEGDSKPVQIKAGQYMLALGGDFGGGTARLHINMGPATKVPVDGAEYVAPKAEVIWLPTCTMYVSLTGVLTPADLNVAIAALTTKFDT